MAQSSRRRFVGLTAALITLTLISGGNQTAFAVEENDESVVKALAGVAPEVLEKVIGEDATGAGEDPRVEVPTIVTQPISIISSNGTQVDLRLPNTGTVGPGEEIAVGIVSFDNGDDSYSVPIIKDGGSVQVVTVITSADAPTRYEYFLTVPDGASLTIDGGGMVIVRDAKGGYVAGILPAWAKDVNGASIPTHYEIAGNVVTQVVEHNADSMTLYPVVADPWLGIDLFQATYYNRVGTYKKKNTTSGLMSAYAQAGYYNPLTTVIWGEIMRTAGWSELATKRPLGITTGTLYPSIRQQYDCHVVYGRAFWLAGWHWDMEHARANFPGWPGTALDHKCNW